MGNVKGSLKMFLIKHFSYKKNKAVFSVFLTFLKMRPEKLIHLLKVSEIWLCFLFPLMVGTLHENN